MFLKDKNNKEIYGERNIELLRNHRLWMEHRTKFSKNIEGLFFTQSYQMSQSSNLFLFTHVVDKEWLQWKAMIWWHITESTLKLLISFSFFLSFRKVKKTPPLPLILQTEDQKCHNRTMCLLSKGIMRPDSQITNCMILFKTNTEGLCN